MNVELMTPSEDSKNSDTNRSLLSRLWNWLTAPSSTLTDIGDLQTSRLIASFLLAILVLLIFPIIIRATRSNILEALSGGLGVTLLGILAAFLFTKTKWYRLSIFIFSITYSSTAYISMIDQGNQANIGLLAFIYIPVGLIIASFFLSWPTVLILTGLNLSALFATRLFGVPTLTGSVAVAGNIIVIGIVLMFLSNFRNRTEKSRLEELQRVNREYENLSRNLEQRVETRTSELEESTKQIQKRASQLEAIADVASSVASLQDMDKLLPYITQTVSERFGFYHAGIFLLSEDKKYAVLRAANSAGGQNMLARKHQLRVGQEGVVGSAASQKRAHIALDVGTDAVYFDNPDLLTTRSEIALPLMISGEVIGILDVQSEEPNAFTDEDVAVLNTLANQVAVAIENARLFQQSQIALKELDATFQQYLSSEWKEFTTKSNVIGYRASETGLEPITEEQGKTESTKVNRSVQNVPIILRGTTLGTLNVDIGERAKEYSEEEVNFIQTVADRFALALESARLLEESQKAAVKEQMIGEISGKIGSSVNLRNVLQTAVEELGHKIPGSEIVIELQSNQEGVQKEQG